MKVSIVIGVYNEASTIQALLEQVWKQPLDGMNKEIIVVESNSTDGSREIVDEFLRTHAGDSTAAIKIIHQSAPKGKGNAIREGFTAVTGDVVLIQDGDLEYDVSDYPDLLRPIVEGKASFVLGSRRMGCGDWRVRKFAEGSFKALFMNLGGILFHKYFNTVFGTQLTDPTTMFKVFKRECIQGIYFSCDRFDFDFELVGKLLRAGYTPFEVPISYRSRGFEEGKKIRIFRDPINWSFAILKSRFSRLHTARDGRNRAVI